MRMAMEVLCVSSLAYFSQPNDWKLASEFAKLPFVAKEDAKTSSEQHTASAWLLEDLCSAFNAVLNSSLSVPSRPHAVSVLVELDKILSNVKHKARRGLNGEELALINNHLLLGFLKRLLVESLTDLKCSGVEAFGKFDTLEQQLNLSFSVVALGSVSKHEGCPFSDFELIVVTKSESNPLAETKSSDLRPALLFLMQLLQLKLVSLGESPADKEAECPNGTFRKGLHLDRIGNAVATGNPLFI